MLPSTTPLIDLEAPSLIIPGITLTWRNMFFGIFFLEYFWQGVSDTLPSDYTWNIFCFELITPGNNFWRAIFLGVFSRSVLGFFSCFLVRKERRKERRKEGTKEGRKEGTKEGRKEGRKERRKEGRKEGKQ